MSTSREVRLDVDELSLDNLYFLDLYIISRIGFCIIKRAVTDCNRDAFATRVMCRFTRAKHD